MTAATDSARSGLARIEWAGRSMPVLAATAERIIAGGALTGKRVGISLVLEPKTANLALSLQRAGAEVVVHCWASSTDDDVAEALRAQDIPVFSRRDADEDEDLELARDFLRTGPDIIIDDGASIIRLAHREFPDLVNAMIGAAEETTSGVRPLQVMHDEGALHMPVIAVNDAASKYLFDNIHGTGQSCVMAFLDITNMQLAGRVVVVVGYGWVGTGVARYAAAMGARVIVSEIDPIKALRAFHDGYEVRSLSDAAERAEVVFASTGIAGVVTAEHVERMPEGAILCTAGGGPFELPMDYLDSLGNRRTVRRSVDAYTTKSGRSVLVLAEGDCINTSAAEGNPIEVMDLSLSLQALAVDRLATEAAGWSPGLYPLPEEIENEVARIRLEHEGATLEPITESLLAAMRSW